MPRTKALNKVERQQVVPKVGNPAQPEYVPSQVSWLLRAAKARRQHSQRRRQTTTEGQDEGHKAAEAAKRLVNTLLAAIAGLVSTFLMCEPTYEL